METPFKRILHPTDFSEYAEKAMKFACEMANRAGSELVIMHSAKNPVNYALDRITEKIKEDERFEDLTIDRVVETGDPAEAIITQINAKDIDLVVMGNKGSSGIKNFLFGSTTAEIVTISPVPVLAIPENSSYRGFSNIVFTTDYHSGDLAALKKVVELADMYNSEVHVLHVAPDYSLETEIKYRGFRELARERINYKDLVFDQIVNESFYTGFADYLNDHDVSLLSLTRYEKPFFQNLMEKDHTKQMTYYTKVPLLILIGDRD